MTTNALNVLNFMKAHPGEEFTKQDLAAQLSVKNTYQLYRDYLDNFKINIEKR